jgi:hypothetical protein
MYRLDGRELLVKTFGLSQPTPDERSKKCPILSCEYHDRGFACEYDKHQHILTHYKGAVVCPFCPVFGSLAERFFGRIDVFKRHLTAVHSVERLPFSRRSQSQVFHASARELLDQHGDASAECSICFATFANAQEMYEHLDDCVIRFILQEEPSEAIVYGIEGEDHQNTGLHRISETGVLEIEGGYRIQCLAGRKPSWVAISPFDQPTRGLD